MCVYIHMNFITCVGCMFTYASYLTSVCGYVYVYYLTNMCVYASFITSACMHGEGN